MTTKKLLDLMSRIFLIILCLELSTVSNTTTTESNPTAVSCQLGSNIECKNNKLDLMSVGCAAENTSIEQNGYNSSEVVLTTSQAAACPEQYCKACRKYEEWSQWSECCENKTCQFQVGGSIGKYRKARYRNLSSECQSKFSIDPLCSYEVDTNGCNPGSGRGVKPNGGQVDSGNGSPTLEKGITTVAKMIIFAVAGVVVFALFGFAGVRLVRTMYLQPNRSNRSRLHSSRSNNGNGQYSNASFRSGPDAALANEVDPRLLVVHQQRGHRMMPTVNRLSIIQEEEDAASTQDLNGSTSEQMPLNSSFKGGKLDGNNALEYMDDIITQIEDDERAIRMEDPNYRSSVVREESFKLLNKFGWNPEARHAEKHVEKLKDFASSEKLESSALSLASASLLKTNSPSGSSSNASLQSESESYYSLQDINLSDTSPGWPRQYSSEPDLSRMKHTIPDIDEVLGDSDSDVFMDEPLV